ncbi:MAG: DUF4215 domain-containing protein, partial [Deltaproteobacteria bacterium]|nr:DUF4215 domain-containing protein [Deltaproteobacteria bacterium]
SLGLGAGELACGTGCRFNASGCEREPVCGNGVVEEGEECDEGASNSDTEPGACRTDCTRPGCGDGVIDPWEECDGTELAGASCESLGYLGGDLACGGDCRFDKSGCQAPPECGNGVVEDGEECDGGVANADTYDATCTTHCRYPSCGDGIRQQGEECDFGSLNSDLVPDACRTDCSLPACGDMVADSGEDCDDGNGTAYDGCDACSYSDIMVNTEWREDQGYPVVAAADDGRFVVVWQSYGQDGSGYGVYGQRYDAVGNALGGEFRVNTTTADQQDHPSVSMDATGDFVVVWQSSGQDGSGYGVYGQRYDASGNALGGEFRVNTTTANTQEMPSVSMDATGDFVVVWESYGQDGSGYGVYGQRYDASGNALGGEFCVNTTTADDQGYPSVSMDAAGDFVVVWQSLNQDGPGYGVYGQRYDAAGAIQGNEFLVNTTTAEYQWWPSVSMDAAGDFVVVWESQNQDGDRAGVYGQRYDAAGNTLGNEFLVNTTTAESQWGPSVSMDATGDFVVVWQGHGQDGDRAGAYGQRYDAVGNALGGEFRVNTTTASDQWWPSVSMDATGDFVVVWESQNQDGDGWGVFAALFTADGARSLPGAW